MYVVPTKIIFSDREYTDGVDITPSLVVHTVPGLIGVGVNLLD